MTDKPTVVCLCGSTRFWRAFRHYGLKEILNGRIVLSIGLAASDAVALAHPDTAANAARKAMLDELHLRKIDLADEILVLNVGGYIGESTSREIAYAYEHGKRVRYIEKPGRCYAQG
jgi:hypothetical protein